MKLLKQISTKQGQKLIEEAITVAKKGNLPTYIPLLNQVNSNDYALSIISLEGETFRSGDRLKTFPLMSVIKPFSLLYLLSHQGSEWVFERVGKKSSDYRFNSLTQLILDQGFPRNSMINSGAIRLADLLLGETSCDRSLNLKNWLNQQAHSQLFLDEKMLASVRFKTNKKNLALAIEMANKGNLENIEKALDTYNQICCLSGTIQDLEKLGMLLMGSAISLKKEHCQQVQMVMSDCGLYEASAKFAQEIGFPTKSGVSGVLLSLIPNQGIIAVYSPPLDQEGNSLAGLFLIKKIASILQ